MDRIDWVLAVRGASTGFSVLIISGLLNGLFNKISPVVGLVQLVIGALAASVVAAWRSRTTDTPMLTGAVAALLSYTLAIPLIYLGERRLDYRVLIAFAAIALAVGAITGLLFGRRER
jgi:hypothetical protein